MPPCHLPHQASAQLRPVRGRRAAGSLVSVREQLYDRGSVVTRGGGSLVISHRAHIGVVVATAVVAIFRAGAATGARGTGTAAVCKTFSTSGLKTKWTAIV